MRYADRTSRRGTGVHEAQDLSELCLDEDFGIYAQPERNERKGIIPNALQKEFAQRFIYGRSYLKESWGEYLERHKERRLHT